MLIGLLGLVTVAFVLIVCVDGLGFGGKVFGVDLMYLLFSVFSFVGVAGCSGLLCVSL